VQAWTTVATVWAHILFSTGRSIADRELVSGGKEVSNPIASVRIRWRTGMDARMRLLIGGVPYDIVNVIPDERDHRFVDLVVVSGANNG
jgi:SPP1 family predicted phage head-tail adaptor